MRLIIFTLIASLLSSCKLTERKAKRQIVAIEANYSYLFANPCARLYPITERRVKEIEYLPGKTDTIPGKPVYVNCADSANQGKKVKADCPPSTHRVDTSKITESIEKESTAKLEFERQKYLEHVNVLESQLDSLNSTNMAISKENKELKEELKIWKKVKRTFYISLGVLATFIVLYFCFRFSIFGKIGSIIKSLIKTLF